MAGAGGGGGGGDGSGGGDGLQAGDNISDLVNDAGYLASGDNVFINSTANRVGINTNSPSSDLTVGGLGILTTNGTVKQLSGWNSIRTSSGGTSRLTVSCGELQAGGGVGASKVSIVPHNTSAVALGLRQFSGGKTTVVQIQDSTGKQTMGLSLNGLTQAGDGNGIARFDLEHTVAPGSADGDGVGLNLRTENASGVMVDIGSIDAVFDDISAHEASLRFSIKDNSSSASPPREVARFNHDGVLILNNAPTTDPAIVGAVWNDAGTLKISAG